MKKILSAVLLLGAGAAVFYAGMVFQGRIEKNPQQANVTEDDAYAMHQLLAQSGAWYALREMTTTDMRFHSVATAMAKVQPDCPGVWERWGSQDFYLVPVVSEYFWNEAGDGSYRIVCGTAYHVRGRPTLYEPRMVIYYASKGGYAVRVDENDQVWRRTGSEQWVIADDKNLVQAIKEGARKVVLRS